MAAAPPPNSESDPVAEFFSVFDARFFDWLAEMEDTPLKGRVGAMKDDDVIKPTLSAESRKGAVGQPTNQLVIGFGHNIKPEELPHLKGGASVEKILETLVLDVAQSFVDAQRVFEERHGPGSFNSLSKLGKQLMTERVFNAGVAGARAYRNFSDGLRDNDFEKVKKHARVGSYVMEKGKRVYDLDERRTNLIHSYIDSFVDPFTEASKALSGNLPK